MSEETEANQIVRKSASLPGGACDLRVGPGAIQRLGREMGLLVGKPRVAVLVLGANVPDDLADELDRQLADGGFRFSTHRLDVVEGVRDTAHAAQLFAALDEAGATSDDVLVVAGDVDAVSLANYVAGTWCGGMPLVAVPTDALACMEALATPRALDVTGGSERMLATKAHPSLAVCDVTACDMFAGDQFDDALAIAASTSVCDNSDALGRLSGRAEALLDGDPSALAEQIVDVVLCRASLVSSTSLAVRQGTEYGQVFTRAMSELVEGCPDAVLMAEGMRFASRVAVGLGQADVDVVYGQDALLDQLGLGEIACEIEPDELIGALRDACFKRTNRFLLPLPLAFGRVRLTSVDEDVLAEHAAIWCESRLALLEEDDEDADEVAGE